jgi:hypothetical protein
MVFNIQITCNNLNQNLFIVHFIFNYLKAEIMLYFLNPFIFFLDLRDS